MQSATIELAKPAHNQLDRKTDAIVAGARATFLAKGYDAASMDEIALLAGVSKRTVYNRFRSKEELFAAAITASCKDLLRINLDVTETDLPDEEIIRDLAYKVAKAILDPDALALRRIAAFEAQRTPSLGKTFLKHGPELMVKTFEPIFERFIEKGAVVVDDPKAALWRLGTLITEPLHTKLLMGVTPSDLEGAISEQVDEGVRIFLKVYGK